MIKDFPSRIIVELTPLCNLSCFMCPRHYITEKDGCMEETLFKKLIDEIVIENPNAILLPFWRGESCMHENFNSLLQYALNKNLKIHLSTNGHFMDKEKCDIFYQCEFLTFSIHTDKGYRNALEIMQNKPQNNKTIFQISFVDSEKTTAKYLQNCIEDSSLNGFDSIRLYKEHTIDGKFGNAKQNSNQKRIFCPKLIHTFVISADGYFSRCNHIWETQKEMNLKDYSIREVWHSDVMQNIRSNYPDNKCKPCDQWSGHTCGEAWSKQDGEIKHKIFA